MNSAHRLRTKLTAFKDWLSGCGAEVLEPTNEWEVVRFKSPECTSVIYTNKVGGLRFVGQAEEALKAFSESCPWRAAEATRRRKKLTPEMRTIRERDGDLCFFCQEHVSQDNESIEHLVALTHGGPQHISNKFLAHKKCNGDARHLSAPEKIKIHTDAAIAKVKGGQS